MDFNVINSAAQSIQPVHIMMGIFIALILGALMQLPHMKAERRSNLLGKLLGKVVMFVGSLAVGAFILTNTLGGSLPVGDINAIIQQVQGAVPGGNGLGEITNRLPLGTSGNTVTTDFTADFRMFDEINRKLAESGVFTQSK